MASSESKVGENEMAEEQTNFTSDVTVLKLVNLYWM